MSERRERRRDPAPDPDPRAILLAVLGTIVVLFGLFADISPFERFSLVMIGSVLAILYAFHSRVNGLIAIGKFGIPIDPNDTRDAEQEPEPTDLEQRRRAREANLAQPETIDWGPRPKRRYR